MIRCSYPSITDLEKKYVNDALDKGDIGVGEYIGKFEEAWAKYNHKEYGVACNSGTSALYLALLAIGIKEGDEVIVPEYTMVSTAWAVTYTGAKPVFVDCCDDLNIDPCLLKNAITEKTKAIILVPIYGRPVDKLAYYWGVKNNIPIVEDMAEAHGMMPRGDIACYSFHSSKIIQTGGGGMCLTDNKEWADRVRYLSHLTLNKNMDMLHLEIGYNFRLSNIQAAIGLAQVERIDEVLEKRRKIVSWYDKYIPESMKMPPREVLWVYDVKVDNQDEIKQKLLDNGIESRYAFKPMSRQPMYLSEYKHLNAHKWSEKVIYLPTYTDMTELEVMEICKVLRS